MFSIELLDQKAQDTEFGVAYEQAPGNSRVPNLMKSAFPMTDPKVPKLYFKIKAKDAEKLDLAIEKFLGTFMIFINDSYNDLAEIIRETRIQVGHFGKNCIVMIPLDSHEVYQSLVTTFEDALSVLNDTGIRASGTLGLGITLKDILGSIDRNEMKNSSSNPQKMKEINEKSNLFRLITHGIALRVKVDIAKKYLKQVRIRILKAAANLINSMVTNKIFNFCLKALKGIHIRLKLSPFETYGLFQSSIGEMDLPDAADLIDEIGMMANHKLIRYYDNIPFVRELVDAIHEQGHCDMELGYSSPQRTCLIEMHTQGIKEVFDAIMQGFS